MANNFANIKGFLGVQKKDQQNQDDGVAAGERYEKEEQDKKFPSMPLEANAIEPSYFDKIKNYLLEQKQNEGNSIERYKDRLNMALNPELQGPKQPDLIQPKSFQDYAKDAPSAIIGSINPASHLPFHVNANAIKEVQGISGLENQNIGQAIDRGLQSKDEYLQRIARLRKNKNLTEQANTSAINSKISSPRVNQETIDGIQNLVNEVKDPIEQKRFFARLHDLIKETNIKGGDVE